MWTRRAGRKAARSSSANCDNQYSLAEMKGEWLFMLVASQQHGVVINPACGMAEFYLDLRAAKMLATGVLNYDLP